MVSSVTRVVFCRGSGSTIILCPAQRCAVVSDAVAVDVHNVSSTRLDSVCTVFSVVQYGVATATHAQVPWLWRTSKNRNLFLPCCRSDDGQSCESRGEFWSSRTTGAH